MKIKLLNGALAVWVMAGAVAGLVHAQTKQSPSVNAGVLQSDLNFVSDCGFTWTATAKAEINRGRMADPGTSGIAHSKRNEAIQVQTEKLSKEAKMTYCRKLGDELVKMGYATKD